MAKFQDSKAVIHQSTGSALAHMPAIDAVRGVAILMVLMHHFSPAVSGSFLTRSILNTTHIGWIGVDLFFVLSGFLITSILLKTRHSEDYFLNFYARRTLRIFPVYYAVLAILLLVAPVLLRAPISGQFVQYWFGKALKDLPAMLDGQGWLWLYGTNVKIAIDGVRWGSVNHFWSLAVEEHFYLVWPLVVYFVGSRERLIKVCMVCILGAPVLRGMMMLAGFDSVVPYVLTPCRVDSLAIGALISILSMEPQKMAKWRRRFGWMTIASVMVLTAIIITYQRYDRDDTLTTTLGYSLLGIISAYVLIVASQMKRGSMASKIFVNPVFTSLGKYSYGIYVTHMFFAPMYARLFSWTIIRQYTGSYWTAIIVNLVLSITCAWIVAWLSYHAMEKHFLKLKSVFDYRKPMGMPIADAKSLSNQTPTMVIRPATTVRTVRQAA